MLFQNSHQFTVQHCVCEAVSGFTEKRNGVIDRARTGDNQNHNLGLYQLSYDHRWKKNFRCLPLTRQVYGKQFPVHKLT